MSETIVLDPTAVAVSRTQLDVTSFVKAEGIDWGDAEIQAYLADQAVGSAPVDYRIPNRQIKIPLSLRQVGATTFAVIRSQVQQKAALFQREGGWIMRQIDSTPLYADVVNATLHLGGSWQQAYRSADVDAVLTLECVPDWYGAEVTLDAVAGTGRITSKLKQAAADAVVAGNYPGRVRIVISDTSGNDQKGLLWGLRSRHYDPALTAALAYEAEALMPLSGAAGTAFAGASGGSAVVHNALPAGVWVPVLATDMGGTASLTHRGSYRVWARCSGTANPTYRLAWGVGSLAVPSTNDPVTLAGTAYLDLGEVRLDPAPVGTHEWTGVVQAKVSSANDQVAVDALLFQPLDEYAGRLAYVSVPPSSSVSSQGSPATIADDASNGGTPVWTVTGPVWTQGTTGALTHYLKLTNPGFTIPSGATIKGISCRVNWWSTNTATMDWSVRLVKGGTIQTTDRGSKTILLPTQTWVAKDYGSPTDLWGGAWLYSDINSSGFGVEVQAWTGKAAQVQVQGVTITVYYTLAAGFVVSQDAVLYAGGTAELRTEGMTRDAGGAIYGPVSQVTGDLPRIPPSGLESRPVELFVKPSRGDFDTVADSGLDGLSAQVKYRPSYLYVG